MTESPELDYHALCIDTNIFHHTGYALDKGLPAQLDQFAQSPVQVVISEVVDKEMKRYMVERIRQARAALEKGLELPRQLPLRKARHHFATRLLQAGSPVRVVAEQLGSDERPVLKHYGPWLTRPDDRARAEAMATAQENESVPANNPAKDLDAVSNQ